MSQLDLDPKRIACQYCGAIILSSGMRQHQKKTNACKAKQNVISIPSTMEQLDYRARSLIFDLLTTPEERYLSLSSLPGIDAYQISYRAPGWGKYGRFQSQMYIDTQLLGIIRSTVLTDDEKRVCLKAELNSPEFRAAYATAALAGLHT